LISWRICLWTVFHSKNSKRRCD
jgi:hypothetical protein